MTPELRELIRESARLHRATIGLFETLPPERVTGHLAVKAERIARQLERAIEDFPALEGE